MPLARLLLASLKNRSEESLHIFKRFGASKRFYSSRQRSTSSNKTPLPLPEQSTSPSSWRSLIIPGSIIAGIGGLVFFIHYNDEKRANPKEFDSRIVGLTGPVAAIRQMAQQYHVFFKKVDEEGDDYLVESSQNMYLMNPNMEVVRCFGVEYGAG